MADLTILPGGRDPAELAQLEVDAGRAMTALADALPPSDHLHEAAGLMADALELRNRRNAFKARRAALKPSPFDAGA